MGNFREVDAINSNTENVFDLISRRWMLVTAGKDNNINTMTASWGCLGYLWNKNIAVCFIRKERHTFKFLEENDFYTLSFFPEKYRDVLNYCGTHSGKDVDKIKEANLTPIFNEAAPFFEEANMVLICKKIYTDVIKEENIIEPSIVNMFYKTDGQHKTYVGEIVKVLRKKGVQLF